MATTQESPTTPGNTKLAEDSNLPLQITPSDTIDAETTPNTPLKDHLLKKKTGKLASKRKLFLQNGKSVQIKKAKKYCGSKISTIPPQASKPTESGPRGNYPLTERQQLQYLLEVTAKEAKQDTGSSSNEDLPTVSNKLKKKDVSRDDNQFESRIRKRNERGETALHVAAIKGDMEDVGGLIKAGALVNAKDNAGWTPLHEACNYGNLRIVQELVWSGANVNSPGYEAITPLHDAVINDHVKVVKFLLENGADPKLRTSQNYSPAELARSADVFDLVRSKQTSPNNCAFRNQESQFCFHPSKLDQTNLNFPGYTLNGVDVFNCDSENLHNVIFEPRVNIDAKNDFPLGNPYRISQDKSSRYPQENVHRSSGKERDEHFFHEQSFQNNCNFSKHSPQFSTVMEFKESQERKDLCTSLSSFGVPEGIYTRPELRHQSWNDADSTEVDGIANTDVLKKSSVTESASENLVQNHTKETASDTRCPNSLEEALVAETLVRMNKRKKFARKPGVTVVSESEEDAVVPERLNECLDKAMIEISTYLGTSETFDAQGPSTECDVTKGGFGMLEKDLSCPGDRTFPPNKTPQGTPLRCDLGPKSQPASLVQNHKTDQRASENDVLVGNLTQTATGRVNGFQPTVNFTKIKPRSERKRECFGAEKSNRFGRRKRAPTRSSESSKHETRPSLEEEECSNHLRNVTWRAELPKCRYNLSDISPCVPGFEDFVINSRRGPTSLFTMNERGKEVTSTSQLDELVSQHNTEKVKLRMTLEQELVRLFGNRARKAAGYQVPYSACSIIMSQMGSAGLEMKRVSKEDEQPTCIKFEVDTIMTKFNRLKSEMLKRHKREIEVIIALEKFHKLNDELSGDNRMSTRSSAMNSESPTVYSREFELLPAKFVEYYEDVLCATD